MLAVIFEVYPASAAHKEAYMEIAAELKPLLEQVEGFVSIERFQSLTDPDKLLSLSFWRDEHAIETWRNLEAHRLAQVRGREEIFRDYRIRIVGVVRDYGMSDRSQAPRDSRERHGL